MKKADFMAKRYHVLSDYSRFLQTMQKMYEEQNNILYHSVIDFQPYRVAYVSTEIQQDIFASSSLSIKLEFMV